MKTRWILLFVLVALTMISCGSKNNQSIMEPESPPSLDELTSSTKAPSQNLTQPVEVPPLATIEPNSPSQGDTPSMPDPSNPILQNLIKIAVEDLAKRISISKDLIQLKDAKSVVWSDSSLGCPQPGMAYADVLSPGYLILLNVNDKDYEYHAGKNSDPFLCENPSPPVPNMPEDV